MGSSGDLSENGSENSLCLCQVLLEPEGEQTNPGLSQCHPSFMLTSIYDHTILEAFSKVVQTLIPQVR